MEAISYTGLAQHFRHVVAAAVLSFILLPVLAHAKPGLPVTGSALPRSLNAEPYALNPDMGKVSVLFTVRLASRNEKGISVNLQRTGTHKYIAMNDTGKEGDPVAGDGVYSAKVVVDTARLKPDSCFDYKAVVRGGRTEVASSPFALCVSAFPLKIVSSDIAHPAEFSDGSKAVANELVMTVRKGTKAAVIQRLASSIEAKVVGSIPALNFFQLRLSPAANSSKLLELVKKLREYPEVTAASINAIGQFASADTLYPQQSGLQQIRAQDVWGSGATGWDAAAASSVIVTVLDSGLDRTHPDFGTSPSNCQLAENDCGGPNDDATGHGTQVAGVIAAQANNGRGIAGIAYGSKIHSIPTNSTQTAIVGGSLVYTGMVAGFDAARTYTAGHGFAKVINASFNAVNAFADWNPVCNAIEQAVWQGGQEAAIVVNATGNEGQNVPGIYPGRCNDLNSQLIHKSLFITVASSDTPNGNYGAWVDISAPGSAVWTTTTTCTIGPTCVADPDGVHRYASPSGTSFSAPFVSGAAAILASCGVSLNQIESTLKGPLAPSPIANMQVIFPDGTHAPRLDISNALQFLAPTATNLNFAETYTEDTSLNLVDIVIVSNLANCATITATLTLPIAAGALTTGTVGMVTSSFTPTGTDGVWRASGALADVEALLAGVTFNPTPNYNGNFTIATSVSDGLTTITGSKAMTGIAVNDVPVAVNDSLSSVAEDSGTRTIPFAALTGNDDDGDPEVVQTLTITAVSNAVGGTVAINGTNVEFTPTLNFNGTASFDYTVQDNGQTNGVNDFKTGTGSVSFAVTPVNDAPVVVNDILSSVAEDSGTRTIPFAALTGNDDDGDPEVVQTLTITAVSNAVGGTVAINGTNVEFTPTLNFNGTASFDYTVQDNGQTNGVNDFKTGTGSVSFAVTPVNDPASGSLLIIPINPNVDPPIGGYRHAGDVIGTDTSGISDIECPGGFGSGPTCSFIYQWEHRPPNGPLTGAGASAAQYTLDANDRTQFMGVCVDFTDTGGSVEHVCSSNDAYMVGDPHITTVDGLHYDFQSAGEFVALRGANGMEIQLRMTAVSTAPPLPDVYTGLTSGVSVNTAVAARVGKHRVTYQPDTSPTAAAGTFVLRVDKAVTTLPAGGIDLGDGGRVLQLADGIQIDFPDQTTLMVNTSSWPFYGAWWLHVSVFHTPAYEGLIGARSKGSWLPMLSNGAALGAMPASLHDRYVDLYVKFADSWRVNKETSLFDYADGTSTAIYANKAWPTENGPYETGAGPVAQPLPRHAAELACRDIVGKIEKANCVFDVRVMGHKDLAKGHLLNQKIRLGAVNVIVRPAGKLNARGEMVVTATVVRHATVVPKVKGVRAVPAGTVQFMLGDKPLGKPVKLNAKGQAKLVVTRQNLERFNVGKQAISARYLPAKDKANVFLPSISRKLTRELATTGPVVRGNR